MRLTDTTQALRPGPLRLFVIASIRLYREGLAEVLCKLADVAEVGTAEDGQDGIARIREFDPCIVLLDMSTPNSAETARALLRALPTVRTIALGVPETEAHVLECAEAGVAGYVPREGSLSDLVAAVRSVARGEVVCSPHIAASLMRRIAVLSQLGSPVRPLPRLTEREKEIVDLVALGMANREIARHLGIGLCTVKNHVHHILEKLGVQRRHEVKAFTTTR